MKRTLIGLAVLATLLFSGQQERKPRPPEIEILELKVYRTHESVTLDGRIKNAGEKPAVKVLLEFDFREPDHQVVTTRKGLIDEELLEPGQESVIQFQTKDVPRAVAVTVRARAEGIGELKLKNAGPFVIE